MNEFMKYIFQQVSNGSLPQHEAKSMIMEIQSLTKAEEHDQIAIIGMSGKYPMADNLDQFWDNIASEKNCISEFPDNRKKDILPSLANPFLARLLTMKQASNMDEAEFDEGGYLNNIDFFDNEFFSIPKEEALNMDPSQRIMLEVAYEAVEDAGYGGQKLHDSKTGVFIGKDHVALPLYKMLGNQNSLSITGSWPGILASRISYFLNLKGPSMIIDTSCSSGLVAILKACQAIWDKECDMAIAGGVCILLQGKTKMMDKVESVDQKVRTFDSQASGTIWGEGVGAILLKPLKQALIDRDHIHAVIMGGATNNDGASGGLTSPSMDAQEHLMKEAWKNAKIEPDSLDYIEAHGTGTIIGDPIEVKALSNAMRSYTDKKQFCGIGTVKTNIGHTVAASGLAGLTKIILALKHERIPGQLNFEAPNPYINFQESPLYVLDHDMDWKRGRKPRRAGISSFGFSGTNCNLIIEEAPQSVPVTALQSVPQLFTISARSESALQELISRYVKLFDNTEATWEDICYTATTGRGHYSHRLAFIASNVQEAKSQLIRVVEQGGDFANRVGMYAYHTIISDKRKAGKPEEITISMKRKESDKVIELMKLYKSEFNNVQRTHWLNDLSTLYLRGADVDWDLTYASEKRSRVNLPLYPLERKKMWFVELMAQSTPETDIELEQPLEAEDNSKQVNPVEDTGNRVSLIGRASNEYSEMEYKLAAIWAEMFELKEVNVEDDFFDLGGHSLLAIKLEVELELQQIAFNDTNLELERTLENIARSLEIQDPERKEG